MFKIGSTGINVEDELLLCLARTARDDQTAERVKILVRQGVDWSRLLQSASHHRIVPMLYRSLHSFYSEVVPDNILQNLKYYHDRIAKQNLFYLAELIKLIDFFEQCQFPVIPYKGPTLALLAYGNVCLRQFNDLDFLVHKNDQQHLKDLLITSGYQMGNEYPWEVNLIDTSKQVHIDIHTGLAHFQFPFKLNFYCLMERLKPLPVADGKIKTFCVEDMLIVLCIQLVKDSWVSIPPLHLSKICDISELLRFHPTIDWQFVLEESKRLGCQRIVLLGLTVAHELVGAPIPESVIYKAHTQPNLSFLTNFIYTNRLLYKDADYPTTDLSPEKLHFKVRERWRDKLYPFYYMFIRHFIPSYKDQAFLEFPKHLSFLYFVIRPIRLTRDVVMHFFGRLKQL